MSVEPAEAPGQQASDLGQRAGIGARWAVMQAAGKHGIDLLVFLILAKLLAPQAFGLVAMAGAVIVVAGVLVELGLGDALLQRRELDASHEMAAFWASLAVGASLACAVAIAAPWITQACGHAELTPILRALTPLFLIQSLTVVPQALLQRDFGFRHLALRALLGTAIGGITGIAMALAGAGAWALVAQQLVSGAIGLIGLYLQSTWRPRWQISGAAMRELLAFGRHVMAARLLNVAASKADAFLVGLVLGPLALGFYSVACRMLLALEQLFCQGVDAVALSAFSRAGEDLAQVRQLFLSATRTAAIVALPVFGGVALLANDIVAGVIGAAWLPSAPLLQVLMGAGLIQALTHFNHAVFKACGRPDLSLRLAAWSTGLNVATLAVAVHYGITAVAVSYLVRAALVAPFGVILACRRLDLPLRRYLGVLMAPLMACVLALASAAAMVSWMDAALHPLVRASVVALLGLAVYTVALRLIIDSRARAARRASLPAKPGGLANPH